MVKFLFQEIIFVNNMKKNNLQNNKGFTLVEMMVSVAIFSIVVMIALGAILTILDANRKARTLTEVMNNLNFSVEMITRSLKTGVEPGYDGDGTRILYVNAIVLEESGFERERTRYRLVEEDDGSDGLKGRIEHCADLNYSNMGCATNEWSPITSELIDIDSFEVIVVGGGNNNDLIQPRTQIVVSGTVKVSEKISSSFSLQTSVSQRRLNLAGSELD
jgi:prepilin-type N-terminal cleavage/methylation domain-containing protein